MDLIKPSRRGFLIGLGTGIALLAAPPIVRASSIMPVKVIPPIIRRRSWHHIAIGRADRELSVYVDGIKIDTTGWDGAGLIRLPHGMFVPTPPQGSYQEMMKMGTK